MNLFLFTTVGLQKFGSYLQLTFYVAINQVGFQDKRWLENLLSPHSSTTCLATVVEPTETSIRNMSSQKAWDSDFCTGTVPCKHILAKR